MSNDRKHLEMAKAEGVVPASQAKRLKDAGLVESSGESSGRRGYASVKITKTGLAQLAA